MREALSWTITIAAFGLALKAGMMTFDLIWHGILPRLGRPFQRWYWKRQRKDCEVCGRRTKPSGWFKRKPVAWICMDCRLSQRGVKVA